MKSTPTFGAVVADLTRAGFAPTDLLPLIPPGAILGENSKVQPHQIGKIPGRYRGGVWYGLSGQWAQAGLSEADVERAKAWPTQNVGLRAGAYPGIDCDTETPDAYAMAERIIHARFGDSAPVRYRGEAPRALHAFKLSTASDPIRKHRIEWTDKEGRRHAVEVLGLGQQYVISGIHPAGMAYEWRERDGKVRDLAAVTADGLPAIKAPDVLAFMHDLKDAIVSTGGTVQKFYVPARLGPLVDLNNADPVMDDEVALGALNAIPNTVEVLPTRESLVAILSSFKQAVGRNADKLYPDVLEWATRHGWADEGYVEKVWDSLTTSRVPHDHLITLARRFGWRGDAALDFELLEEGSEEHKKVQQQIIEADPLRELADKLVYLDTKQLFIVKASGELFTPAALNASPELGARVATPGTAGVKSPANQLCAVPGLVQLVKGIIYLPGKPTLTEWTQDGRTGLYYNRWHARVFPRFDHVTDDDVRPWLDHVAYLIPNDRDRGQLLDFFAHLLQRRGTKIRWAPLIIGRQGTGKDLMIKPIVSYLAHNARDIKPEQLTARFNDFLESELLVVQEMKRSIAQANGTYNRIKTLIAGTAEDVNYIERKYETPYAVPNVVNSIMFSNHLDAMEIDDDDRRFGVINSEAEKKDTDYYRHLAVEFYQKQSGWLKVASWLMQRDLSNFDPSAPPFKSEGKAMMIEAQRSNLHRAIEHALSEGHYKDRAGVTSEEILKHALAYADFMPGVDRRELRNATSVANVLIHLGWKSTPQIRVKGRLLRFWTRPGTTPPSGQLKDEYAKAHPDD